MKIKESINKKIIKNDIDNEYCVLLDAWMSTEFKLDKNLISKSEAVEFLEWATNQTKKAISKFQKSNKEIFEESKDKFEKLFKSIEEFISNLSLDLKV